jgi:hypothetical protein
LFEKGLLFAPSLLYFYSMQRKVGCFSAAYKTLYFDAIFNDKTLFYKLISLFKSDFFIK